VFLAVPGLVEGWVGVEGWNGLVVVHRIGMVREAPFAKLLGDQTFTAFQDLAALSLAVAVFDPASFYAAVAAAVFLREPSEELAAADDASLENLRVSFSQ
jgi:hypothetical protein